MKIGVVTYWYGDSNYGMILQCWALQQYLKSHGHEPFVIRYRPKGNVLRKFLKNVIRYVKAFLKGNLKEQLSEEKSTKQFNSERDKVRCFNEFRERFLDLSEFEYYHLSEIRKNPPAADCYITGSDQVWCSVAKSDDSLGYFLCFGEDSIKRIAYAPSIGKKTYPPKMMDLFAQVLGNFDAISCREYSAVELCKQAGYLATKVEDPTLLLDSSDYDVLCSDNGRRGHVFVYSVNIEKSEDIYWNEIIRYFGLDNIVVTPASGNFASSEIFGEDANYVYATPGEWLALIKNSKLVITSSFHGVVFSILFNKRFAYIPLKGRYSSGNDRITELLNNLGLNYLIVERPYDYQRILQVNIDWNEINKKRRGLISTSKKYLDNTLK